MEEHDGEGREAGVGEGGAAHGLEVEGREVPAGEVDEAVCEADDEAGEAYENHNGEADVAMLLS